MGRTFSRVDLQAPLRDSVSGSDTEPKSLHLHPSDTPKHDGKPESLLLGYGTSTQCKDTQRLCIYLSCEGKGDRKAQSRISCPWSGPRDEKEAAGRMTREQGRELGHRVWLALGNGDIIAS